MRIQVKICGLRDAATVAAAVTGGAKYAGFVFYPQSPRFIRAEDAASLITNLPPSVASVGLFVDASDDEIMSALRLAPLQMIQLHGAETPEQVGAVRQLTGLPVIKAVGVADAQDIDVARRYESVADMLLLDAKPQAGGLPGGNAAVFDWGLLDKISFAKPWLLAGGLNEWNVAAAVKATGALFVDVSSGVESAPGVKDAQKIRDFLQKTAELETC